MLKIPNSMYGKGPKNNPAPMKSWDTSGDRAYGDSRIRMLTPESDMPKLGQIMVSLTKKIK